MGGKVTRLRCFAKVNLGLRVLRRRDDGYHDLRSVMHTIDLHDTLEIRPAKARSLEIRYQWAGGAREDLPADGRNLVLKAARTARARGHAFTLTKRIPAGAGLGGGSSDAARISPDPPSAMVLHGQAASVGSDTPFFLYGGAGLSLGHGDDVYPLPNGPVLHLVLAFPAVSLSTPEVYEAWDRLLTSPGNTCRVNDFAPWCLVRGKESPSVANDLEEAAIRLQPPLKELRSTLETSGARAVAMTGSGSAFYGIYRDEDAAALGAQQVRDGGYDAVTARTLSREERDRLLWA
jgi:4-diphosphocytidyl-2-C-methyl-D-erythritol kinase